MDKPSPAFMSECRNRKSHASRAFTLTAALIFSTNLTTVIAQETGSEALSESASGNMQAQLDGKFSTLYEPSGVVPLPAGRFLVIEDEPNRALRLITADTSSGNALSFKEESHLKLPASLTERLAVKALDDLEGAAHDQQGRLYVISSHDDAVPHWSSKRQKLLRFSIVNGQMQDVSRKLTLRRDLLANFPQLENTDQRKSKKQVPGMNIEALAYDRRRDVLLIGFRTPVLDGRAIIVRLMNPDSYLNDDAPAELAETPWSIDLDKGGLRGMTYDDQSDQLLLVSRRENHKDDDYKLWRMAADGQGSAVRIDIGEQEDMLKNVEGLASITLSPSSSTGLLLVRDNGNEKKAKGADWFVLPRKSLGLEPQFR